MKNINYSKIIIFIIILIAAWALIVPGIVGMQTQDGLTNYENDAIKKSAMPVTMKLVSFNRGWFFSTAKSDYTVMIGGRPFHLLIDHQINQFAIPFYRWAKVTHNLSLQDDSGVVSSLPVNLLATTEKMFFGACVTQISAPEIDWKNSAGAHVSGKRLALTISTKQGEAQSYELNVPILSATAPGDQFTFNLLNLDVSGTNNINQAVTGIWQQHALFRLENVEAVNKATTLISMHNLNMEASLTDHGDNIDLIYRSKIDIGSFGGSNGFVANDINLDISYLNLNKSALLNIQSAAKEIDATTATDPLVEENAQTKQKKQQAQIEQMLKKFSGIIVSSPSFKIDQLSMKTSNGDVKGSLEVHVNGEGFTADEINIANFAQMLKARIYGIGSLRVARNVFLGATDTSGASPQRQMKENMLKAYVSQGYVIDDGKTLIVDSSFGPQGIDLNGKHLM